MNQNVMLKAEKAQTNTLVGIIFILAIATALGAVFLEGFTLIGADVISFLASEFTNIVSP